MGGFSVSKNHLKLEIPLNKGLLVNKMATEMIIRGAILATVLVAN